MELRGPHGIKLWLLRFAHWVAEPIERPSGVSKSPYGAGTIVASIAREHSIHPITLRVWKRDSARTVTASFPGNRIAYSAEAKIA
jgi:hypothetical protein